MSKVHLDDNTLELLALNAAFSSRERLRLTRHLAACVDCRNRIEEIREFYAEAEAEFTRLKSAGEKDLSRNLVPSKRDALVPGLYDHFVTHQRRAAGAVSRLSGYIRVHPVKAALGGVVLAGALGVAMIFLFRLGPPMQPAYVGLDLKRQSLDVYSEDDTIIWRKPARISENSVRAATDRREQLVQVVDVDDNGVNEVVTTYKLARFGTDHLSSSVAIFNADGSLRVQRGLAATISYRGRRYDTSFNTAGMLALPGGNEEDAEIYVCVPNRRSPFALVRLDAQLNQIGAYWHFGHLYGPRLLTVQGGRQVLVLWGTNDDAEERGLPRSAIVVLDPSSITGPRESSATPGFGFAPSNAEMFYIRFSDPDIVAAASGSSSIQRIEAVTDNTIHVVQVLSTTDNTLPGVEYVFDMHWSLLQVKPIAGFEVHRRKILAERPVSGITGEEYYRALGQGIRYWNGRAWVSTPTTVMIPA